MPDNFISVSAITDRDQLEGIANICQEEKFSFPVVIGYQVSNKSINHGTKNSRQPKFEELGDLDRQTRDYGLITAVHYYTKNNRTIKKDLEKITELGIDPSKTLLQLNTLPPSIEILRQVNDIGYKIILKVAVSNKQTPQGGFAIWKGNRVEDVSSERPFNLIGQVYDRREFIDYVMFDPSHGTNLDLNLDEESLAIKFGKVFTLDTDLVQANLGLVYAGGIKPNNVRSVVRTLNKFFPNQFSIDAESGIRTDDRVDLNLVRDYLVGYRDETS